MYQGKIIRIAHIMQKVMKLFYIHVLCRGIPYFNCYVTADIYHIRHFSLWVGSCWDCHSLFRPGTICPEWSDHRRTALSTGVNPPKTYWGQIWDRTQTPTTFTGGLGHLQPVGQGQLVSLKHREAVVPPNSWIIISSSIFFSFQSQQVYNNFGFIRAGGDT